MIKCWSCAEIPNDITSCAYVLYSDRKLAKRCSEHRHSYYPTSFHDRVRCMTCKVDYLDPSNLGMHHSHQLTGQGDWIEDYRECRE
jgi:hypothetical protein